MQLMRDCRIWLYSNKFYLDKEWNGVEPSDNDSVVDVPGQDVQSSCAAFHDFLHTHSLLNAFRVEEKGSQIPKM